MTTEELLALHEINKPHFLQVWSDRDNSRMRRTSDHDPYILEVLSYVFFPCLLI